MPKAYYGTEEVMLKAFFVTWDRLFFSPWHIPRLHCSPYLPLYLPLCLAIVSAKGSAAPDDLAKLELSRSRREADATALAASGFPLLQLPCLADPHAVLVKQTVSCWWSSSFDNLLLWQCVSCHAGYSAYPVYHFGRKQGE